MENRRFIAKAILPALLAATVCACTESPPPPPPILLTIGGDCDISAPELMNGDTVKLGYFGACEYVDVDFGDSALFGCASVRLNHGETVELSVVSPPSTSYTLTVACSCDPGGGHTTPEIKVGPPPPPTP